MPETALLPRILVIILSLAVVLIAARGVMSLFMHAVKPYVEYVGAEYRARRLLRAMLSPAEYQQLMRFGFLEIPSPSIAHRIYRIPGSTGMVKVFESGSVVMELCLQSAEPLPASDIILLHKLMITGNETEYLTTANRFSAGTYIVRNPPL